jgi:hypothetical protein
MYDNRDYITRTVSNAITEIGFDEDTPLYLFERLFGDCLIHSRDAVRSFDVCAPSHTQVFRWLINKHGVIANIIYDNEMNNYFFEYCYLGSGFKKSFLPLQANSEDDIDYDYGRFDSYHEAANACILNIVEYIKERKRNIKG